MNIEIVNIDSLVVKDNSRMNIEKDDLTALMESIKDVGLLQPIGIRNMTNSRYEIVFGNRRFFACKKLKLKNIPAIVYDHETPENEIRRIHLTENLVRKDLSPYEEGREFVEQKKLWGYSDAELASWLSIAPTRVRSHIQCFQQTPEEFRGSIARMGAGSVQKKTGKIPVSLNNRLIGAKARFGLTDRQTRELYQAAKINPQAVKKSFTSIVGQVANNEKINFEAPDLYSSFVLGITVPKKEVERINRKYIKTKMFSSFGKVLRAILNGELNEKIRCESKK